MAKTKPTYSTETKAIAMAKYMLGDLPADISKEMDIPVGTIKSWMSRSRDAGLHTVLQLSNNAVRQKYEDGLTRIMLKYVWLIQKLQEKVIDEDKLAHATLTEITQALSDVSNQHGALATAIRESVQAGQGQATDSV